MGQLIKYPEVQANPDIPLTIFRNSNGRVYTAMSGLVGKGMPESVKPRALFSSEQTTYTLTESEDSLSVTLSWTNEQGLTIQKIITFTRASYSIGVRYRIQNTTAEDISATFFGQLKRDQLPNEDTSGGGLGIQAYLGTAYSTKEQRYETYNFCLLYTSDAADE